MLSTRPTAAPETSGNARQCEEGTGHGVLCPETGASPRGPRAPVRSARHTSQAYACVLVAPAGSCFLRGPAAGAVCGRGKAAAHLTKAHSVLASVSVTASSCPSPAHSPGLCRLCVCVALPLCPVLVAPHPHSTKLSLQSAVALCCATAKDHTCGQVLCPHKHFL